MQKIDFHKLNKFFSSFLTDYLSQSDKLKPFYGLFPSEEHIIEQTKAKSDFEHRDVLVSALKEQYQRVGKNRDKQIETLYNKETFTITTGHQLNFCTGPLYLPFKLLSVIRLCEQLNQSHIDKHFVPVYWMATEDHDWQEVNHFFLQTKQVKVEEEAQGAVGRHSSKGAFEFLSQEDAQDILNISSIPDIFVNAYKYAKTWADAMRIIVDDLFGEYGLLILDGDDQSLKELSRPLVEQELKEHTVNTHVSKQNQELEKQGYSAQAFAREINLFYLDDTNRSRIQQEGKTYKAGEKNYSLEELEQLSAKHFSPNVLFRPLYQETVLPNLAYVGGPAEIAYWMQLKSAFEAFRLAFPILIPRVSGLILGERVKSKLEALGLSVEQILSHEKSELKKLILGADKQGFDIPNPVYFDKIFDEIRQLAEQQDKSLVGFVEAEKKRALNQFKGIIKKLEKARERKHHVEIQKLESILEQLLPNGSLQERKVNIIPFLLRDKDFIAKLLQQIEPLDFRFNIIELS